MADYTVFLRASAYRTERVVPANLKKILADNYFVTSRSVFYVPAATDANSG